MSCEYQGYENSTLRVSAVVGISPDGRPIVSVGTFDKRILALVVETAIRLIRRCEKLEYVAEGHPIYVFSRGASH